MVNLLNESLNQVNSVIDTIKRFNEMTAGFMNKAITDSLKSWPDQPCRCSPDSSVYHGVSNDARIICPPQDICPPRCLLTIIRHANPGETVIVPFRVRNRTNSPKTYLLGVRVITDQDGTTIAQPTLDKLKLAVKPGMSAEAEMKVVINNNFVSGSLYETDIVIRERRHNQNICFRLYVDAAMDIPEVAPYDEKDIDTHFHRWYHHYYCENERNLVSAVREPAEDIVVTHVIKEKEVVK